MVDNVNVVQRIPNLPLGPIVDKDGNPTQNEQLFRQALIDLLQLYLSPEGIVAPPQPPANVTIIQNAVDINGRATCLPGTIIYEQDTADFNLDKLVVAFRQDDVVGSIPVFKEIQVV